MSAYNRSEHIIGHGKKLAFSNTQNGTFTNVAGTVEVNLPERELGASEITNDDSPDFHKDYQPGMYEPGTVGFTYQYGKTQFAELEAIFQLATVANTRASATKWWRLTLPDGAVAKWQGFLTKHDLPVEGEDGPIVEGEMQVIGKVIYTPSGGS